MKDIPEYEQLYAITSAGRVWAYSRSVKSRPGVEPHIRLGHWMKLYLHPKGYYQVLLNKNQQQKCFWVHRLVANTYIAPVDGKLYINHKNGVKTDNSVGNLEWCTHQENLRHALKTGLRKIPLGQKHGNSTISDEDVKTMRELWKTGKYLQREIGEMFGTTQSVVSNIVKMKSRTGEVHFGF